MNMKTLIALAVAGAFATPIAALSADDDKRVINAPTPTGSAGVGANEPPRLDVLDLNNDGQITVEEASRDQMLSDRFGDYDKDRDGKLSRTEQDEYNRSAAAGGTTAGSAASGASGDKDDKAINAPTPAGSAGHGALEPPRLDVLDLDNDGQISREEAMKDERLNTRFSELDKDNDGRLSRSEWEAHSGSAATGTTGQRPTPAGGAGYGTTEPPQPGSRIK